MAFSVADFSHAGMIFTLHSGRRRRSRWSRDDALGNSREQESGLRLELPGQSLSLFLAVTLLELIDPALQLLNAVKQRLHRRLRGSGLGCDEETCGGEDCASTALVVNENKSNKSQREPINLLLNKTT